MANASMTLAEGRQDRDFRTDASLVLNGVTHAGRVLRTSFDSLSVWKTKYAQSVSPFYPRLKTSIRETAVIDNEIWVFKIDGTQAHDIIDAVTIGVQFYKESASAFLSRIYIKNLNVEGEDGMDKNVKIQLNKDLYEKTVIAIKRACEHFGVNVPVDIYVYSAKSNPKIPSDQLHQALRAGGASSIETDSRELSYKSGSNSGKFRAKIDTNLHLAKLNV
jgi:hypothetical protein